MKLSENTLAILNNFKNLNNSILFYPGKEIKNLSADKSVYLTATIEEEIPKKFAVLSLRELLQVISILGHDADIDFRDDHLFITNGQNSVFFRYANVEIIDDVYQRKITLKEPAFEVDLPLEQVKNLFKMSSNLGIRDVQVVPGDRGQLVLYDAKASHQHKYTINTDVKIGSQPVTFNISVLSMLDMGYKLSYHPEKNLVRFSGIDLDVKYHVPCSLVGK